MVKSSTNELIISFQNVHYEGFRKVLQKNVYHNISSTKFE